MPLLARRFSITNFLIATSALGFQVFVLYPWHHKLDDDFEELKRENLKLMQRIEGLLGKKKSIPEREESPVTKAIERELRSGRTRAGVAMPAGSA